MTDLPIPSDREVENATSSLYALKDAKRNQQVLQQATSPLPPSGPVLMLAHDLAAALDIGDTARAFESASALGELVGAIHEVLDIEDDFRTAAERALERTGLRR